tara:strand:+ start:1179 stop:1505 length:327 start_codon:yes stop_codon:yes gene_type:complete
MKQVKQKELIHRIAKSKEITLTELAKVLNLELSSFRVTLERNNLMLHQFLAIYKYAYDKEYETDSYFLDIMRELYDFTLKQYVEAMKVDDDKKVIVTLYNKTKIQLIN